MFAEAWSRDLAALDSTVAQSSVRTWCLRNVSSTSRTSTSGAATSAVSLTVVTCLGCGLSDACLSVLTTVYLRGT